MLRLPRPAMQLSVQDRAYVGVPLWLWVAGGQPNVGPLTATATAGAAQVTATARLARTVWAMGPPDAVVTCPGTGRRGAADRVRRRTAATPTPSGRCLSARPGAGRGR